MSFQPFNGTLIWKEKQPAQLHDDELPAAQRPDLSTRVCVMSFQPCADLSVCFGRISKSSIWSFWIKRHRYIKNAFRFCYDALVFLMFNVSERCFVFRILLTMSFWMWKQVAKCIVALWWQKFVHAQICSWRFAAKKSSRHVQYSCRCHAFQRSEGDSLRQILSFQNVQDFVPVWNFISCYYSDLMNHAGASSWCLQCQDLCIWDWIASLSWASSHVPIYCAISFG